MHCSRPTGLIREFVILGRAAIDAVVVMRMVMRVAWKPSRADEGGRRMRQLKDTWPQRLLARGSGNFVKRRESVECNEVGHYDPGSQLRLVEPEIQRGRSLIFIAVAKVDITTGQDSGPSSLYPSSSIVRSCMRKLHPSPPSTSLLDCT